MKTKVTIKTRKKRRYTEEEIYAMPTIEGWKVTFDQLPHRKLVEYKYDLLLNIANSPFQIADTVDEAMDLLKYMHDAFEERYNNKWGNQKQNATLAWVSGVNHNRILADYNAGLIC